MRRERHPNGTECCERHEQIRTDVACVANALNIPLRCRHICLFILCVGAESFQHNMSHRLPIAELQHVSDCTNGVLQGVAIASSNGKVLFGDETGVTVLRQCPKMTASARYAVLLNEQCIVHTQGNDTAPVVDLEGGCCAKLLRRQDMLTAEHEHFVALQDVAQHRTESERIRSRSRKQATSEQCVCVCVCIGRICI